MGKKLLRTSGLAISCLATTDERCIKGHENLSVAQSMLFFPLSPISQTYYRVRSQVTHPGQSSGLCCPGPYRGQRTYLWHPMTQWRKSWSYYSLRGGRRRVRSKSSAWLTLKYGHFSSARFITESENIPTQYCLQLPASLNLIQISSFKTTTETVIHLNITNIA